MRNALCYVDSTSKSLREHIPDESVDLAFNMYPPFGSNAS